MTVRMTVVLHKMTVAVEVVNDSENDSGIVQTEREGV